MLPYRHDVETMNIRLKPLQEQVIVVTGASSGIGLVTARMAAKRGARRGSSKSLNGPGHVMRPPRGPTNENFW